MNGTNDIMQSVKLVASTKDSLYLEWGLHNHDQQMISGYKVTYQAVGSNVVQKSPFLEQSVMDYDIAMLHEDTNYEICVEVFTNGTHEYNSDLLVHKCIQASTSTDSLSVALGSTFGAFLALGIIVGFVFLAKWQHTRKLRKQMHPISPSAGSYDSMVQPDGDYEMSDVSLQVHEDTLKTLEMSSQSSQANGTVHLGHIQSEPGIEEDDEDFIGADIMIHEPPDAGICPSTSNGGVPISVTVGSEDSSPSSSLLPSVPPQPYIHFTCTATPAADSDGRPPDVRPKEKALHDLTHLYANKDLFEQPQSQLRPNMSCNW